MKNLLVFFIGVFATFYSAAQTVNATTIYFPASGTAPDGFPYARFNENFGIRFNSPDSRWVFSSKPSVLIGYVPAGQNWGDGNLMVQGNVGIGTTSPSSKLEISDQNSDLAILKLRNLAWACNQRTAIEFWNGVNKNFATSRIASQMDGCGGTGEALLFETQTAGATSATVKLTIKNDGNVGIGTTSPDAKLAVKGTVHAQEVKVDLNVPGPDYVFEENYNLPSLTETESYIKQNKHLPEVPSAKEMETNGINLSEMNMVLLKKVEELTLYVIELKKRDDIQQTMMDKQAKEILDLKKNKE